MSAFIVDRNHVEFLVAAALHLATGGRFRWDGGVLAAGDTEGATRVGQMLWDENIRSVLTCYPQDTRETAPGPVGEDYRFRYDPRKVWDFSPANVLKACHCWQYQTCETPDHATTEAWKFVDHLEAEACRAVPGYDAAPWGAPAPLAGRKLSRSR